MRERVPIDKLNSPVQKPNDTLQTAEQDGTKNVSVLACLVLGDRARLSQHVDDGNDQRAKTDTTEGVSHGALESSSCWSFGHVVGAEVPTAVDT